MPNYIRQNNVHVKSVQNGGQNLINSSFKK